MIPHIKTDNSLVAIVNGTQYVILEDNPSFNIVWQAVQAEEPESVIEDLFNTALAIRKWSGDNIEVSGGVLLYKGEEIHGVVVNRILQLIDEGNNADALIKFLENLLANPSKRAVDELYTFLQHSNLPITEDGCFLAYKGVNDDYTDLHTGKFVNRPGAHFQMQRNLVDDDARRACSNGFHVGSLEYATSFGPRTEIVKVNPKDVVSVPLDHDCQKCRVAEYSVLCDYQGPLPKALHTDSPYEDANRWNMENIPADDEDVVDDGFYY